jgi:hypothetical protein
MDDHTRTGRVCAMRAGVFPAVAATLLMLLGAGIAAAAGAPASPALVWRPLEVGYGCEAAVTADRPREGAVSLRLRTQSAESDKGAWFAFVRVEVTRADGRPLGLLSQLVIGGCFTVDLFRSPETGGGIPDYTLPWVALRVRNPDGEEAVLLWESAYNGWHPSGGKPVPVGVWLDDVRIDTGIFWMKYQGRNYNAGKGFQKLSIYAGGMRAGEGNTASLKLVPGTGVVAVEVGSGANLPGLLVAYVGDVRLRFAGGASYRYGFAPPAKAPLPAR